jgi:hypothetical protein
MNKVLYDNKNAIREAKDAEPAGAKDGEPDDAKSEPKLGDAVLEAMEIVLARKEAQVHSVEEAPVLDPAIARWIPPRKRRFR